MTVEAPSFKKTGGQRPPLQQGESILQKLFLQFLTAGIQLVHLAKIVLCRSHGILDPAQSGAATGIGAGSWLVSSMLLMARNSSVMSR